MLRECDSCGKAYEAKRQTSKFCSPRCRMRAQRSPKAASSPVAKLTPSSDLAEATRRELEQSGRLGTVLGQQAMALAARIASPHETGSSVASLSKEFRAVMEAAMDGVGVAADPLDELRARRDRIRSAG